jgi:hypothetical protein
MLSQRRGTIELRDRDIAFLRGLFECRVMTIQHVASLYFEGHGEYAKKRLQKLKSAGLLTARPRKQFEPAILFLTTKGIATLHDRRLLELYPKFDIPTLARRACVSDITLQHELAVMDLKVAFHVATRTRSALSILEFTTWPILNQFTVLGELVKPDAFVRVRERTDDGIVREHSFYVELDRSTELLATLCRRARSYAAHYRSGHFAGARGVPVMQYQKCPFRVLYVLCSNQRRDNVARRLLRATPPILSLVWLATMSDLKNDPFQPIWKRPVDYKTEPKTGTRLLNGIGSTPLNHHGQQRK